MREEGLPEGVTHVYIGEEVLRLPIDNDFQLLDNIFIYRKIFTVPLRYDPFMRIPNLDGDPIRYDDDSLNKVNVILPDSIEAIQDYAFEGCTLIKSITIPNSVTHIGRKAFAHCVNLEFITWSDNLQKIEDYAFCRCKKLKEVVIPDSVTTLGRSVFAIVSLLNQ